MMRSLANPQIAQATVERAWALGINHIETAQAYGSSELYLAEALQALFRQGVDRSQIHLTTKVLPSPDPTEMAKAIQRSLDRLGLDYLDCLAIHGLNTWEHLAWVLDPQGGMTAVATAVARGQVRYVGFSSHGSLPLIQAAMASRKFAFVNLHYTLFGQRNALAISQAAAQDMGVFLISPADKGGLLYTPAPQLANLCAPYAPLHLNARFLLSHPQVTTLSVGPANPQELDWPLAVADQEGPLEPEERAVLARLSQHQAETLGTDRCSQCYACLPCPEDIAIPEILRLRNLSVAYEMTDFGQYRYRMFENAGHWFPGRKGNRCTDCGDCLPRCPEQLDIPRLLRDTHDRLAEQPRPRLWEGF
jgi:uncharacterized protein